MFQTRRRPAETGRGEGSCKAVRADATHDTTADTAAVDRLPPATRERYLRDCARWQTAYRHHRAIMRLLAEVA